MSSHITETILQPRTGSQCPFGDENKCKGYKSESGNAGWTSLKWNVTLGSFDNAKSNSTSCTNQTCEGHQCGAFQGKNGNYLCIRPVKELCTVDHWDGYNYNPDMWEKTPLDDTIVSAHFPETCKMGYTRESPSNTDYCNLRCTFDASKFDRLDQVQAWEKKYGKYTRGSGKSIAPKDPTNDQFSENYEKIMQNFCSQRSTECHSDPMTGEEAPECSMLKSNSPGGDACRYWLDNYGTDQFNQNDIIGFRYCSQHPNSYDCRCVSRDKSETFQDIQRKVGAVAPSVACYYLPCADAETYIVGSDIMNTKKDPTGQQNAYGYSCGDNVCLAIYNLDETAYNEMEGNRLYIQCGGGIPPDEFTPGDVPTNGWSRSSETITTIYKEKPAVFWSVVSVGGLIIFILIGLIIYYYVLKGNAHQSKPNAHAHSKPAQYTQNAPAQEFTTTDEPFTDEPFTDGSFTDGSFTDGSFTDGSFTDGSFTDY